MHGFDGGTADVAQKLRAVAQQFAPPYSLPAILGAAFPDAIVTGRDLPDGVEEVVSVTGDGALILYRRDLSTAELRFAVAHAIGHLVFDVGRSQQLVDEERERRADEFALELLAPHRLLAPKIVFWPDDGDDRDLYMDQVDRIATVFHVPPAVIDQRIRELALWLAKLP